VIDSNQMGKEVLRYLGHPPSSVQAKTKNLKQISTAVRIPIISCKSQARQPCDKRTKHCSEDADPSQHPGLLFPKPLTLQG